MIGQGGEETVAIAEDHTGAQDDGRRQGLADGLLSAALGGGVVRGGLGVGAQGRHQDEVLDAAGGAYLGHMGSGLALDGFEALTHGFIKDSDQVDAGGGAFEGAFDIGFAGDVAAHDLDLTDVAHGLQVIGDGGFAHGDADAPALPRQGPHDLFADKARTAENRDYLRHDQSSVLLICATHPGPRKPLDNPRFLTTQ